MILRIAAALINYRLPKEPESASRRLSVGSLGGRATVRHEDASGLPCGCVLQACGRGVSIVPAWRRGSLEIPPLLLARCAPRPCWAPRHRTRHCLGSSRRTSFGGGSARAAPAPAPPAPGGALFASVFATHLGSRGALSGNRGDGSTMHERMARLGAPPRASRAPAGSLPRRLRTRRLPS